MEELTKEQLFEEVRTFNAEELFNFIKQGVVTFDELVDPLNNNGELSPKVRKDLEKLMNAGSEFDSESSIVSDLVQKGIDSDTGPEHISEPVPGFRTLSNSTIVKKHNRIWICVSVVLFVAVCLSTWYYIMKLRELKNNNVQLNEKKESLEVTLSDTMEALRTQKDSLRLVISETLKKDSIIARLNETNSKLSGDKNALNGKLSSISNLQSLVIQNAIYSYHDKSLKIEYYGIDAKNIEFVVNIFSARPPKSILNKLCKLNVKQGYNKATISLDKNMDFRQVKVYYIEFMSADRKTSFWKREYDWI